MLSNDIGVTILMTTLLILLLISVVVVIIFVSNKRHVQQEMKLAQAQLDYERDLRQVQEQVMTAVAMELHDNVGQRLTFMNMHLGKQRVVNPDMSAALQPISDMMMQTMNEVRVLGRSLNSDLLEKNGLAYSIGKEVKRIQQLDTYAVHWDYNDEALLDKDQKVMVFRIFQEVLNNIIKHAGAENIYISMKGGNTFKLEIKDDGRGFDLDDVMRTAKGAGLKNILQRAALAKLKCRIDAVTGKGTVFTLEQ